MEREERGKKIGKSEKKRDLGEVSGGGRKRVVLLNSEYFRLLQMLLKSFLTL